MSRKLRSVFDWLAILVAGAALGLGVAWFEQAFAIPKIVVQGTWLVLIFAALGYAGWVAWRYYRAIRDENEWD